MFELINLTPHDVVIIQDGEVILRIPPSGKVARVQERNIPKNPINGIPTCKKEYGEVEIISREDFLAKSSNPKSEPFAFSDPIAYYIVPMLVGQLLAGQIDGLIGPDTGIGGVRDKTGTISGAVGFIRY